MTSRSEAPDVYDCRRCGARTLGAPCDGRTHGPDHEAMQLFDAPALQLAPAQLAGQTELEL